MQQDDERRALALQINMQRALAAQAKATLKDLEDRFSELMLGEAAAEFNEVGKSEGEVTFVVDGIKVIGKATKTVKWDSNKLQAVAAELPWTTVERLFDIKFSMKESVYKAIPDESLRAKVNEARTTKVAPLAVSFIGFSDE